MQIETKPKYRIGDKQISYTVTAYGVNGEPINNGHLWCTCYSVEDARKRAVEWFRRADPIDPQITRVHIYGAEYQLGCDCWRKTGKHLSYEWMETDQPIRYSPADLVLRCYDSTVMDYFETVHPKRADGTCHCGDPTRNTPR